MSADATLRMKHWCYKHGLRTFDCGCEKTVQEVMTVAKTKTKPGDVVFKSGNGRELLRLGGDGGFWVEGILLPYVDGDAIAMGLRAFLKASGFDVSADVLVQTGAPGSGYNGGDVWLESTREGPEPAAVAATCSCAARDLLWHGCRCAARRR